MYIIYLFVNKIKYNIYLVPIYALKCVENTYQPTDLTYLCIYFICDICVCAVCYCLPIYNILCTARILLNVHHAITQCACMWTVLINRFSLRPVLFLVKKNRFAVITRTRRRDDVNTDSNVYNRYYHLYIILNNRYTVLHNYVVYEYNLLYFIIYTYNSITLS